ncbi:hypothetical protein PYCCODRAFT_970150 [Trametes coccinea BRFM310]|uniref:Uncharacterized protein n=1 Tax=Trametes coccinea (strain BRFM310) TaxID=1353009 RepID=A0A1Y2IC72_TRAC3|nr:hypothetical protein PYCCODRAFT_970150 [Trametes coccinea BRFM310]
MSHTPWLRILSSHLEALFVVEGTATNTRDGSGTNEPTRNPPPRPSGRPVHVSPAVPAVVVIACLLAVVAGAWWLLRRLRRSQRNHTTLLEMIGRARKPHLFDVSVSKPQILSNARDGDWDRLTPLAATKLTAVRTTEDTKRIVASDNRSVPSHVSVQQRSRSMQPSRRPQNEPKDSLQVAVLIAMPSDAFSPGHSGSFPHKQLTIPPTCVGIMNVKYRR